VADVATPSGASFLKVPHLHTVIIVVISHMWGVSDNFDIRRQSEGLSNSIFKGNLLVLS
jgi:hypothetical protein